MSDSMVPAYDRSNVFARILRGELPCKKVHEDQFALAFHDIAPLAPIHVLVIPKGEYVSQADFGAKATPEEIVGSGALCRRWRAISASIRKAIASSPIMDRMAGSWCSTSMSISLAAAR